MPAARFPIAWLYVILPMSMISASARCPSDECPLPDFPRYPLSLRQPGVPGAATGAPVAARLHLAALHRAGVADQPGPDDPTDELDVFGNPLTRLAFERPHDELLVNAQLTVEVLARPTLDFNLSPAWEETRNALTYSSQPLSPQLLEACRYRFESPYVHLKRNFVEFSESCFPTGRPLLLGVQA